jgi:hypothetical protein
MVPFVHPYGIEVDMVIRPKCAACCVVTGTEQQRRNEQQMKCFYLYSLHKCTHKVQKYTFSREISSTEVKNPIKKEGINPPNTCARRFPGRPIAVSFSPKPPRHR